MSIFSRNKRADGDKVAEQDNGLDLPMKPASRSGGAIPAKPAASPPARPDSRGEARTNEARPTEARQTEVKPMAEPITRPAADMARRLVDSPAPVPARQQSETRKLIVGKEISLQGEINSCDHLVVEGSVGANLASCREVEIMESGVYKGSADIDQIEVRGLFEGTLHVKGRLMIRSTGRVVGTVRYGQIEIEIGGQISGEIQAQPQAKAVGDGAAAPAGIL